MSAGQTFPPHSGGSSHRALHVLQTQLQRNCSGELGEDLPPTCLCSAVSLRVPRAARARGSQLRGSGISRTGWAAGPCPHPLGTQQGQPAAGWPCPLCTSTAAHQAVCSKPFAVSWFRNTRMMTATLCHMSCLRHAPQTDQSRQGCVGATWVTQDLGTLCSSSQAFPVHCCFHSHSGIPSLAQPSSCVPCSAGKAAGRAWPG